MPANPDVLGVRGQQVIGHRPQAARSPDLERLAPLEHPRAQDQIREAERVVGMQVRHEDARQLVGGERGNAAVALGGGRAPHHAHAHVHQVRHAVDDDGDRRTEAIGVGVRRARAEHDEPGPFLRARHRHGGEREREHGRDYSHERLTPSSYNIARRELRTKVYFERHHPSAARGAARRARGRPARAAGGLVGRRAGHAGLRPRPGEAARAVQPRRLAGRRRASAELRQRDGADARRLPLARHARRPGDVRRRAVPGLRSPLVQPASPDSHSRPLRGQPRQPVDRHVGRRREPARPAACSRRSRPPTASRRTSSGRSPRGATARS